MGYFTLNPAGLLSYHEKLNESQNYKTWAWDGSSRAQAYRLLIEATVNGAKSAQIEILKQEWAITESDITEFAKRHEIELTESSNGWIAQFQGHTNRLLPKSNSWEALVNLAKTYPLMFSQRFE